MGQIAQVVHESWYPYLEPIFDSSFMDLIKNDVLTRYPFYPAPMEIFNVFKMPVDKIKVVILGQDPYANGEAIGYSFAVREGVRIPKSLEIIRQEIINSKVERDTYVNIDSGKWRTLAHWRQQGVFLLNSALTVEQKNSGSHMGVWRWFTSGVIFTVSKDIDAVWMLWGSKAQEYKGYIKKGTILTAPHPAAETYPNSRGGKFTGCDHFNKCNSILKETGKTIINW